MNRQDWYDMGNQIGDLVQAAIDSNDFKQLNQSITDTINSTLDLVQKNMQEGMKQAQNSFNTGPGGGPAAGGQSGTEKRSGTYRSPSGGQTQYRSRKTAFEQARENAGTGSQALKKTAGRQLPVKTAGGYKGITYMAVGYSFMGIFGILFAIFAGVNTVTGIFGVPAVIMLIMTAVFLIMGLRGSSLNARSKRQKQYLRIMGGRDTCSLEELAAGTGKTKKYVTKDIKEMIQAQMFSAGAYLDAGETCLMTSQNAYKQYQDAARQYEQRKVREAREAEQKNREEKQEAALSKEVQDILKEGKDFIAHIHECNDAIEGEDISEKLDRLENVVTKIFDQVAKKPESAPDLHKMMSYYLPITRKLVDAYRDLDAQTVEGQNITKTKKEIEDSLDTINTAFENLLDSFFQDTAWDISSDISVLHTMMAQDGLMKKDFASAERIKTVAEDFTDKSENK